MAGVGDKDALRFSKTYGEIELPYITHSNSRGTSASSTSGTSSGSNRQHGGDSSLTGGSTSSNTSTTTNKTSHKSTNTQLKFRALFSPAEIRSLPQYHAIIESSDAFGQRWRPVLIDMNANTLVAIRAKVGEGGKAKKGRKVQINQLPAEAEIPEEYFSNNPPANHRPLLQVVNVQKAVAEISQPELTTTTPYVTRLNQNLEAVKEELYPTNPKKNDGTNNYFGE
jgi:hypothetical protein